MAEDPEEKDPVIVDSFASREVRPGEIWKVYLHARHREGSMNRIVCLLEEPGAGIHPASFIKVREDQRQTLSGYIFLNTRTAYGFNFTGCHLTLQIQDKRGRLSKAVSLSLTLNPRASQDDPPPGIFQDQDLGPIQIPFSSTPSP